MFKWSKRENLGLFRCLCQILYHSDDCLAYYYKYLMPKDEMATSFTESNIPYVIASSLTISLIFIEIALYIFKFHPSAPIVGILMLLIINDFLLSLFEIPTFLGSMPNGLCLAGIIGTTFFRLAANYWLIFITRLIYRQKSTPGKFMNLQKYISKSLILTYIPSVGVALLIFIVANLDDTRSEANCYRLIQEKTTGDYIIYISSFILPNLLALLWISGYLIAYFRLSQKKHSLFVVFPLIAVPFMVYYLVIKLIVFLGQTTLSQIIELPFVIEPLSHAIIFAIVLNNISKGKSEYPTSDLTLTIKNDSASQSFLIKESP